MPAGMIVSALSQIAEAAEVKPLNPTEKAEGRMVISAVLYEYGANVSAGVMFIVWTVAVIVPRVIEWLNKQREEKKKRLAADPLAQAQAIAKAA